MSKYKTPRYIWMYDQIKAAKPKSFLEIGVYTGKNIYLINDITPIWEYVGCDVVDKIKWPLPDNNYILWGKSQQKLPWYRERNPGKTFDLIFIDGDHDPEATIKDFQTCMFLCHKNTLLFIDDLYIDHDKKIVHEYGAGTLVSILQSFPKVKGYDISPGDPIEPTWNNHIVRIML